MGSKIVPARDVKQGRFDDLSKAELLDLLEHVLPAFERIYPDLFRPMNQPDHWIVYERGGQQYQANIPVTLFEAARALVANERGAKRGIKARHGDPTAIATAAMLLKERRDVATWRAAYSLVGEVTRCPPATVERYRFRYKQSAAEHCAMLLNPKKRLDVPDDPREAVKHVLLLVDGDQLIYCKTSGA